MAIFSFPPDCEHEVEESKSAVTSDPQSAASMSTPSSSKVTAAVGTSGTNEVTLALGELTGNETVLAVGASANGSSNQLETGPFANFGPFSPHKLTKTFYCYQD